MPDHPIIFSAPMIRALLDGRKTQTRRLAFRGIKVCADGASYGPLTSPWARVQPGDRLWVRETVACGACAPSKPSQWAASFWRREQGSRRNPSGLWYQADGLEPETQITTRGRWVPSIHMPRWASRITLHVEAVRVERLQAISEADATAEGANPAEITDPGDPGFSYSSREGFRLLWNSLHGPDAWASNPEVVVLKFRVVKGNIGAVAKENADA